MLLTAAASLLFRVATEPGMAAPTILLTTLTSGRLCSPMPQARGSGTSSTAAGTWTAPATTSRAVFRAGAFRIDNFII